jgi:hypothetical protein
VQVGLGWVHCNLLQVCGHLHRPAGFWIFWCFWRFLGTDGLKRWDLGGLSEKKFAQGKKVFPLILRT